MFCLFFSGNLHLQGVSRGSCSQSWGESGRQTPGGSSCVLFLSTSSVCIPDLRRSVAFSARVSQVNGVDLHEAEHHTAVEALRSSGATVSMTVLREHMVEPENAITTTPLRPEDDYFPRERRSSGLAFNLEPTTSGPQQRFTTCLMRNDKGLGFSIAGGKGSTPYRTGDVVRQPQHFISYWSTHISGLTFSRLIFHNNMEFCSFEYKCGNWILRILFVLDHLRWKSHDTDCFRIGGSL